MQETVLNIFVVVEGADVVGFRAAAHAERGEDDEKIARLKARVESDFPDAKFFAAPVGLFGGRLSLRRFQKLVKKNQETPLFEPIFKEFSVPAEPLILVTTAVDGKLLRPD
jgi:hypothetical protein